MRYQNRLILLCTIRCENFCKNSPQKHLMLFTDLCLCAYLCVRVCAGGHVLLHCCIIDGFTSPTLPLSYQSIKQESVPVTLLMYMTSLVPQCVLSRGIWGWQCRSSRLKCLKSYWKNCHEMWSIMPKGWMTTDFSTYLWHITASSKLAKK